MELCLSLIHILAATGSALHKDMLKAWTPENKNTDVPRININDQYTNRLTDRFLTSSDYLSLQNITLGYTLPKSLTCIEHRPGDRG